MGIRPTRKDKDHAFQRNVYREELKQKKREVRDMPLDPDVKVMTFGQYENLPLKDVDDGYLWWCTTKSWCPVYVGYELIRRGYQRIKLPLKLRRKMKNDERAKGTRKVKTPKASGTVNVGENYEWLHQAWLDAGGDESICPFGDDYSGPTIQYDEDGPCIYSPVVS